MSTEQPQDLAAISTHQDLQVANLDLPEYVIDLKVFSSGGMGAVYEAKNKWTGQRLAIKVLLPKHLDDETSRKRFMQEARTIKSLSSPFIVASYDYGAPEGKAPYMVMEYIHGDTLGQRIRAEGHLSQEAVVEVFLQVAHGLAHAHSQGILHRDIKPSNIMLKKTEDGSIEVKLVDFGMAKFYGDREVIQEALTISGNIVGTPLFMSPEQCLANPLDGRSDIYSLGCVMYLASSGQLAVDGATVVELFGKHVSTTLDFSILTDPIKTVVARCMEKDPADRYQTVQELIADLQRIQEVGKPKFQLTGKQRHSVRKSIATIVWIIAGFAVGYVVMVLGTQWLAGPH